MKKQHNVIPALMVSLLASAGVYAEETPSLKNPFVVDGQTTDTRTVTERETYVNQVVASTVAGPGHVVVGQSNVVKATDGSTTVIGGQNFVADTAKDGNIFGDGSSITGYQSQAGGDNNHLIGEQNSAFGMNNQVNGNHTHAYGGGNNVTGDQSTATGHYNLITGHNASAFGYDNKALANETTVVGHQSNASGLNASAFGSKATASGESALALGTGANATADSTVAIGNDSNATGKSSVAVSVDAKAKADESIAIGSASTTEGIRSIAIGANATATNESATVVGTHSTAEIRGTVIGAESQAYNHGFAGGYQAKASGESSTAIGVRANSTGLSTIAIGSDSVANNKASTAIGQGATATASYGVALGKAAQADHGSAVALGTAAVTEQAVAVNEATVGKITYGGFAGTDATAVVSVGKKGDHTRQIINVGAGEISATSTDAINGSQLYATNDVINNVAGSVTTVLGGNAQVDNKGNVTMTNIGDTGENTVHDAIKSHTDKIKANADGVANNAKAIATNTADIRSAEQLIDANAKNIAENTKAIEGNTNYIKAVEKKLPEVQAGDNVTVTSTTDSNGKITYTVSSKDYQPAIDAVDAKAETNKANIAENTKAIKENAKGIVENKAGVESNKAKIAEVEVEAKRHSVVKAGKNVTVNKSTGTNGESIYTVSADVDHLATKAEVNEVSKSVAGNTKAIQANTRAIGNLDRKIGKVEKKARAGIASAIAVANIPQVTLPGKSAVGIGAGGHAGQHAVAARYTRMSDNAKWIISGSVGVTSQKEVNYGAGVTYQW